ncbi:MAG: GDP-L-fucose synthase [Devosia sp.]
MAELFDLRGKRVWVAGETGMVGSSTVRRLARESCEILSAPRAQLDLMRQHDVEDFIATQRPDAIVIAAARVGGILANANAPADFLFDNLAIQSNIIGAAHRNAVPRLLFLGSSCIYPRLAEQPIVESSLLTGPLEPTNEAYAVAKIAGIKLIDALRSQHGRDYISAMPTNLYGPGDNFDLKTSHVLPALIRKAHEAKRDGATTLTIWGSGTPRREFLHVDDCADALVFLLKRYSASGPINVGSGSDVSILDLARLVSRVVGFAGNIVPDPTKPDGTPRKLLSSERLSALGWHPSIGLEDGIAALYRWYVATERESA